MEDVDYKMRICISDSIYAEQHLILRSCCRTGKEIPGKSQLHVQSVAKKREKICPPEKRGKKGEEQFIDFEIFYNSTPAIEPRDEGRCFLPENLRLFI